MVEPIVLRTLTSLRTGGAPLRYYRPTSVRELTAALADCRGAGRPWRVMGGGSNLLVEDGRLPFAVVHVREPGLAGVEAATNGRVCAGAGLRMASLLAYCRRQGLGGLEFLAGLPGTVGGAVAGNAGAWGLTVADRLRRVWLADATGGERVCARDELAFSYRHAGLGGRVVTRAEFALEPRDPALIGLQMKEHAARRAERHPDGTLSAGCIFKNPPGDSAGRLLDACGLKGLRVGGAEVAERHANFILNRDDASAGDVLELIRAMRVAVRERFGIELELEVRHWAAAKVA